MNKISETEIKKLTKAQNYFRGYFDGKSDAIDEIRAEIIEMRSKQNVGVLECLDIIDKYAEQLCRL